MYEPGPCQDPLPPFSRLLSLGNSSSGVRHLTRPRPCPPNTLGHCRWRSDSLTVVEVPEGIDSNKVVKNAYAKYDLSLGIGLAQINGKVFRIGHLGNMNELMLVSGLAGAEMAMIDAGMNIKLGSGVGKALEYWQKTASVLRTRESLLA